jgi:hypothetical protein
MWAMSFVTVANPTTKILSAGNRCDMQRPNTMANAAEVVTL